MIYNATKLKRDVYHTNFSFALYIYIRLHQILQLQTFCIITRSPRNCMFPVILFLNRQAPKGSLAILAKSDFCLFMIVVNVLHVKGDCTLCQIEYQHRFTVRGIVRTCDCGQHSRQRAFKNAKKMRRNIQIKIPFISAFSTLEGRNARI